MVHTRRIIDPCDEPVSLTASVLQDQEYTITDTVKSYTVPEYTPDPSWCGTSYSYTIDLAAGDDAIVFNDDPGVR